MCGPDCKHLNSVFLARPARARGAAAGGRRGPVPQGSTSVLFALTATAQRPSALASGEACRGAALSHWAAVDAPPGLARRSSKAAGAGIGTAEKAAITGLGAVPAKSMSGTRCGGGSPAPARRLVVVLVRVGAPKARCCSKHVDISGEQASSAAYQKSAAG